MTEDQKKEALSKEFLRIIAQNHGFKVYEPSLDHGVDMIICPVVTRVEPSGRTRYFDSQYKLDFQLKATTNNGVEDGRDTIKFDLEVKNYNDLISRKDEPLPLHLILVVLSSAPPTCVDVDEEKVALKGAAYWYLPPDDAAPSANATKIRIVISKANRLHQNFLGARFAELGIEL